MTLREAVAAGTVSYPKGGPIVRLDGKIPVVVSLLSKGPDVLELVTHRRIAEAGVSFADCAGKTVTLTVKVSGADREDFLANVEHLDVRGRPGNRIQYTLRLRVQPA